MHDPQRQTRRQWLQLGILTGTHFVLDCYPGLMHTVLPAFQETFRLSVSAGAVLLTLFLVSANGIQVLIGHMRSQKETPLFLYVGVLLTSVILLFKFVSPEKWPLLWLSVISIACGAGVGMTHPEGLRAIHRLDRISSATSSAVFMAGGFAGFAFGGVFSTVLYQRYGIASLIPFSVASVIGLLMMMSCRIRLAIQQDRLDKEETLAEQPQVSFLHVMAMAISIAGSMTIFAWIVPQHIDQAGMNLTLGGLAVALLSVGGGVGAIVFSKYIKQTQELKTVRRMLIIGIPFVILYLIGIQYSWALAFVFIGGFFCFGAYPILVSVARHCPGHNLGHRMGWVVGGVWLVASGLPMILGPIARRIGTTPLLFCVPAGFLLSLMLSFWGRKSD